ncbi:MAG: nucleoside/nucleotide kinase family protein [Aeromicrobium sp.]|nr:nucleoside/nucleotide kinase family protein [Aeromicrobium sp.]
MDATVLDELATRAEALVRPGSRALLGITGAPGAGKTTLADALVTRLKAGGNVVAHVPMDGFHLADVTLIEQGLLASKGAIETFDRDGYLALLRRLRVELDRDVYAPDFERTLEQPIAGAITVRPETVLVVTEGNYLLDPSWDEVRQALDEVWFVDLADDVRRERLERRHVEFGKSEAGARAWVERVDEPNARQISARRESADLVVDGSRL